MTQVGGFEESFRAAQDHDMVIRIAEVTRFAYQPDYLWYYRRHAGSISSTRQELRWQTGFRILERARRRYPYAPATIRKRKAVLYYRMGKVHLSMHRYLSAFADLGKAFLLRPGTGGPGVAATGPEHIGRGAWASESDYCS